MKVCAKRVPSTKEVESGAKECTGLTEEVYIALLKSGLEQYKGEENMLKTKVRILII